MSMDRTDDELQLLICCLVATTIYRVHASTALLALVRRIFSKEGVGGRAKRHIKFMSIHF